MESPGHRPATVDTPSLRRNNEDSVETRNGGTSHRSDSYRPPARPTTQRATSTSPRTTGHHAAAPGDDQPGSRRGSNVAEAGRDFTDNSRSEVAALRQKLNDAEFAKAQAQVQMKRQEAEMVKLERYISQLVEQRGEVNAGVMETILKDIEKSSLMRRTQKQISDLKSELRKKQQEVTDFQTTQKSEYLIQLAKEKEALAVRVEELIMEKCEPTGDEFSSGQGANELKRLRAENSAMLEETKRLHIELEEAKPEQPGGERVTRITSADGRLGGRRNDREQLINSEGAAYHRIQDGHKHVSNTSSNDRNKSRRHDRNVDGISGDGPLFYEGQTVQVRLEGSDSWSSATVDAVRSTVETLGAGRDGGGNHGRYLYTVWFSNGGREDDILENRIRAADDTWGAGHRSVSPTMVRRDDGETVIRQKTFRVGEEVLARDGGSSANVWASAQVVSRTATGTYVVMFRGSADEVDLHPTMLRARGRDGDDPSESFTSPAATNSKSLTSAEEAEIRYEEKREELLAKARAAIPKVLRRGDEVLARYPPGPNSNSVWGIGVIVEVGTKGMHYDISFDRGHMGENIPCVFVRRWNENSAVSLTTAGDLLLSGDTVLAQRDSGRADGDWFPAKVKENNGGRGTASIVFVGEDEVVTSTRQTKVIPLYLSSQQTGGDHDCDDDRPEIPRSPPPPTKPLRAKKHHKGDIVLACAPKLKPWTPAVIIEVAGRGRYSVEWADGTRLDSLLFMHIASFDGPPRENDDRSVSTAAPSRPQADGDRDRCVSRDVDGTSHDEGPATEGRPGHGSKSQSRLRQRQFSVGEPVIARCEDENIWSPGSIRNVCERGKYDVDFTDGTQALELSFFFIRGLDVYSTGVGGDGKEEGTHGGNIDTAQPYDGYGSEGGSLCDKIDVGDSVYVLRRGISEKSASYDMQDRNLWRVGTVSAINNGRFNIRYGQEKGKPEETRIAPERLRPRQIIRQKTAEKGDVVLALSKTPGRGWLMGAVADSHEGLYKISFADGSQEQGIRFVNLRRVIDREAESRNDMKASKSSARPIRQRKFHAGQLTVVKHPDTHEWGVAKVLEAHPSSRYDLELLGQEGTIIMGASFTSMRHLDLAGVASDNAAVRGSHGSDDGANIESAGEPRGGSAESWNECHDNPQYSHHQKTKKRSIVEGTETPHEQPHEVGGFDVHAQVYVLRRGKNESADLQDTESWRPGRIIAAKSNGLFAVQYDSEKGRPKEDRIAEARLRFRDAPRSIHVGNGDDRGDINSRHSANTGVITEGDVVLARGKGRGGEESAMATVVKMTADNILVMEYLDGSGTFKAEPAQVRHMTEASDGGRRSMIGGRGLSIPKRPMKLRKLKVGEVVIAKRPDGTGGDSDGGDIGRDGWFAGKIVSSGGNGTYSVLFAGKSEPDRIHFSRIRPLKVRAEGRNGAGDDQEEQLCSQQPHSPSHAAENMRGHNSDRLGTESVRKGRSGGRLTGPVLRVADVAFSLSMAASAARRTAPHLLLAVGERGQTVYDAAKCHSRSRMDSTNSNDGNKADGDIVEFIARGRARAGVRNPSWRGKDGGEFWLSLHGLVEPELYIAVEDGKAIAQLEEAGGRGTLGEVCIPVPEAGVRAGTRAEIELDDGAGIVQLEWGTHER